MPSTRSGYSIQKNVISNNSLLFALSVKQLFPSYNGNCLRVRRSVDNVEQDFGFVNGLLNTSGILSFCGAGSGYVTKIYNQLGNLNDLANSSASAQPRIVSSGSLVTINGNPGIYFDSGHFLSTSSPVFQPFSVCTVTQCNNIDTYQVLIDAPYSGSTNRVVLNNGGSQPEFIGSTANLSNGINNQLFNTHCFVVNSASSQIFRNNASTASGNAGTDNLSDGFQICNNDTHIFPLRGPLCEYLIYSKVLSTDERTFIHNDQKVNFHTV